MFSSTSRTRTGGASRFGTATVPHRNNGGWMARQYAALRENAWTFTSPIKLRTEDSSRCGTAAASANNAGMGRVGSRCRCISGLAQSVYAERTQRFRNKGADIMNTTEHNFHLEEYKQLRTEVTGLLSRIELLFRYSLLVSATVFAWLLSNSMGVTEELDSCIKLPKVFLAFGWLIPPAFVLCAGLMAATTNTRVIETGEYLRRLEVALGYRALGWESHL